MKQLLLDLRQLEVVPTLRYRAVWDAATSTWYVAHNTVNGWISDCECMSQDVAVREANRMNRNACLQVQSV